MSSPCSFCVIYLFSFFVLSFFLNALFYFIFCYNLHYVIIFVTPVINTTASPSNNCSFLNIPSQSYNNNNNSSGANIDSNNNNVNNNLNLLHDSAINASFASHNSTFQNYNKLHSSEQSFTRNDNLNNCSTNNNISSLHSTQAPSPLRDATTRFKYQATRSLFNSHHFALNKTTNTFATTPPSLPFSRKVFHFLLFPSSSLSLIQYNTNTNIIRGIILVEFRSDSKRILIIIIVKKVKSELNK